MLRTSVIYAVSVLLAVTILIISLLAVTFRSVRAAPLLKSSPSASVTATASANPSPTPTANNYAFPYPGVLPDSPLWLIKAARDRILLWLTFDKVGKAEKMLFIC